LLIIDKYFVDQNCMQKKCLICPVPFLGFLKKNSGKKFVMIWVIPNFIFHFFCNQQILSN
jgi:hypothetical protein